MQKVNGYAPKYKINICIDVSKKISKAKYEKLPQIF